ncbi:MAG: hypothetical protein H7Y00_13445, partial [Fimbriimonadaceae bacterium]|nr:hypothetical protein [Chitinophagales bacterium]
MHFERLTNFEKESVLKYFGIGINELDIDTFKKIRNQLRMKYHPDKFEKLNDETALEMALEKFKEIDMLCERIEAFFNSTENILQDDQQIQKEDFLQRDARYAFKGMYIEIITSDK